MAAGLCTPLKNTRGFIVTPFNIIQGVSGRIGSPGPDALFAAFYYVGRSHDPLKTTRIPLGSPTDPPTDPPVCTTDRPHLTNDPTPLQKALLQLLDLPFRARPFRLRVVTFTQRFSVFTPRELTAQAQLRHARGQVVQKNSGSAR